MEIIVGCVPLSANDEYFAKGLVYYMSLCNIKVLHANDDSMILQYIR